MSLSLLVVSASHFTKFYVSSSTPTCYPSLYVARYSGAVPNFQQRNHYSTYSHSAFLIPRGEEVIVGCSVIIVVVSTICI